MDRMSSDTTMTWKRVGQCVMVIAVGALVLSACSSGGKKGAGKSTTTGATATTETGSAKSNAPTTLPTPNHPVIAKSKASSTFVTAARPANAALGSLKSKVGRWNASTTNAQAEADARPVLVALIALEPKLETLTFYYPAAAKDLMAEITAAGVVQDDIATLGTVNFQNPASWTQKFTSDVAALNKAANVVRSDLGLRAIS